MLRQILLCRYGKALTDKHKVELQFVLPSPRFYAVLQGHKLNKNTILNFRRD